LPCASIHCFFLFLLPLLRCDGVVLSNLPDDITDDDIKKLIEKAVLNGSDEVSILPSETSRSRLIKAKDKSLIQKIVNKIDSKSINGRLIHGRPHVLIKPPKPDIYVDKEDQRKDSDDAKIKENKPAEIKVTEATPEQTKNAIPGLSVEERIKSQKSAEKKKKSAAAKERKKQKQ
jgi:hypothetical protein